MFQKGYLQASLLRMCTVRTCHAEFRVEIKISTRQDVASRVTFT